MCFMTMGYMEQDGALDCWINYQPVACETTARNGTHFSSVYLLSTCPLFTGCETYGISDSVKCLTGVPCLCLSKLGNGLYLYFTVIKNKMSFLWDINFVDLEGTK